MARIVIEIKNEDYGGLGFSCRDLESHRGTSAASIRGKSDWWHLSRQRMKEEIHEIHVTDLL